MDSAMTPNTLKRQLTTDKRRSESVRKVKQRAASKRWQFEYMDSKAPDESESESSSGQVAVHTKEVEVSQPTLAPSFRTVFRLTARLIGLPSNPIDHLDLFIMFLYMLYWTQKTMSITVHCLHAKGAMGLNESASCWRIPLKKQTLSCLSIGSPNWCLTY